MAALASRMAACTASLPVVENRTRSADGTSSHEQLGGRVLQVGLPGDQNAALELVTGRGDDRRRPVPEQHRAHTGEVVDVPIAVDVDQIWPVGVGENQWGGPDTDPEAAVHPAGHIGGAVL